MNWQGLLSALAALQLAMVVALIRMQQDYEGLWRILLHLDILGTTLICTGKAFTPLLRRLRFCDCYSLPLPLTGILIGSTIACDGLESGGQMCKLRLNLTLCSVSGCVYSHKL
jgi:hypothetical protein